MIDASPGPPFNGVGRFTERHGFRPGRPPGQHAQRGKTVEITGLNDPSADLHGKLTGELAGSH
ncbi:hypothetical protein ABZ654_22105 [Streptomyces hygroscopicus]|uniref:hypothetical protein n=1 Tax=Streptomyces hygroscopicus TaxID=1912 RepID=UPI0033E75A7E